MPNRAVDGPGFQRAGSGRHSQLLPRAGPNIRTGQAGPGMSGPSNN